MFTLKIYTVLKVCNHYIVHNQKLLIPTKTSFDWLKLKVNIYFETIDNSNMDT